MHTKMHGPRLITALVLLFASLAFSQKTSAQIAAGGLNFDGVNDYVQVNNPYYQFTNEISVEWWVNVNSAVLGSGIGQSTPGVDNNTNSNVWLMHFDNTNTLVFYVNDNGNWRSALTSLSSGWHHVVGVANASSTKIYVDGVVQATGAGVSSGIFNNPNSVIRLGMDVRYNPGATTRFLNGDMDEIRIWNRALCQGEIVNNKNCEFSGTQPGLVEYYKLNHGFVAQNNSSFTTAADASGNGKDGTLNNFLLTGASSNWIAGASAFNACVWTPLNVTASSNSPVGPGSTLNVSATASGTNSASAGYAWSGPSFTNNTQNPTVTTNAQAANAGTYNVTATVNGCTATTSTSVSLAPTAGALNFDGSNDFVSINNSLGNFGAGDFTVEMNVRTSLASTQYLLSKRSFCGADNFLSMQIVGGKLSAELCQTSGGLNYVGMTGTATVNNNAWHHVAITRTSGTVRLYVDGVLDATGTSTADLNNSYTLTLGSSVCNGQNGSVIYSGNMDEVRFWSRALTQCELANNKSCELSLPQTNLVAYYKFNQGGVNANNVGVTSLTDAVGSNTGTLNNFALSGSTSNWITGNISGTCTNPSEINVKGNSVSITDGDNTPSLTDNTIWQAQVSNNASKTFTIENTGTSTLSISGVTISGTDAGQFTITANPASTVAGGGSTSFTVRFSPTSQGVKNATINVASNDCDENPYDFSVQGHAFTPFDIQCYNVTGSFLGNAAGVSNNVAWSIPTTSMTGGVTNNSWTNYGSLTPAMPNSDNIHIGWANSTIQFDRQISYALIYAIEVDGQGLNFGIPPVLVSGNAIISGTTFYPQSSGCVIRLDNINATSITNTQVQQLTNGVDFAIIPFASNPVLPAGSLAEANIKGNGINIVDGDNSPSTPDNTDFGSVGTSLAKTFTIENTGGAALTVSTIVLSGTGASQYAVSGITLPATIAANSSTTFTVTFTPTSTGVKSATVTINNSDCDEAAYDFAITGTGATGATALDFDGVDDYAIASQNVGISGNAARTIETWVYIKSFETGGTPILYWGATGTKNLSMLALLANGTFSYVAYNVDLAGTTVLNLNQWYHLAVTYDGNGTLKLYVNGALDATHTVSGGYNTVDGPLNLGRYTLSVGWGDGYKPMILDDARIWTRALCQGEIQNNMNCRLAGTLPSDLVAYYKYNQGFVNANNSAATVQDASAGNKDLALNMFALSGSTSNWTTGIVGNNNCATFTPLSVTAGSNSPVNVFSILTLSATASGTNAGSATYSWSGPSFTSTTQNPTVTTNTQTANAGTYTVTATANGCTATSSTSVTVNPRATALSFDGVDDYVSLGTSALLRPTSALTVECWVRQDDWTVPQPGNTIAGNSQSGGYAITINSSGLLHGIVRRNGTYSATGTSTAGFSAGWHHVAMTYDGRYTTLYVDGTPVDVDDAGANYAIEYSATNAFIIGGEAAGGTTPEAGRYYDGDIDQFRVWKRALCRGEILNNMNCELNPSGQTSLVALHHLNQGFVNANNSGSTTSPDASGNTLDGTLVNFALTGSTSNWIAGTVSGTCSAFTPPTASITAGGATTFCSGGSVSLTANSGASYLWSTGATTQAINATTSGNYTVTVTAASGCSATSSATTVAVNPLPTPTITAGGSTNICAGSSVTLMAGGGSAGNALNLNGAANGFLSFANNASLNLNGSSSFTLETWVNLTNAAGMNSIIRKSGYYNLYVSGNKLYAETWPGATGANGWRLISGTTNTVSSNQWVHVAAVWNGSTCTLYVNGVAVPSSMGSGTQTAVEGLFIGASSIFTGQNMTGQIDETRIWNVARTGAQIAASYNSAVANNSSGLVLSLNYNAGSGTTVTDATANGNNGTWSASGVSWVIPSTAPVSSFVSYAWIPGGSTAAAITANAAGSYTVAVTDANGCSATSAATAVTVNSLPTVSATNIGPFCVGDTMKLFSNPPGLSYSWAGPNSFTSTQQHPFILNVTAAAAGTYNLTATDANNCSNSASTTVVINALPTPAISTNSPICAGSTLNLTGSGGVSYYWSGPNGFNDSTTGANVSIASATTAASGTYFLKITGSNGCRNATTASVIVNPNPTVFNVTGGGGYCFGGTGVPVLLSGSQSGVNYQLQRDGNNVGSAMAGTGASLNFGLQTAGGTYTVVATNATTNCTSNMNGSAMVSQPAAALSMTATPSNPNCTVANSGSITVNSVSGGIAPYQYNINDGAYGSSNTFSNLSPAVYKITVKDAAGCTIAQSFGIVKPFCSIAVDDNITHCNNPVSINITLAQLIGNDTIAPGDTVTIGDWGTPTAGSVTYNSGTKTFTYTPPAGYSGISSFTYTIKKNDNTLAFSGNGHFYEAIAGNITWTNARIAAANRFYNGMQGYLVTISSAAENLFCQQKINSNSWIGASDLANEGTWRWVTGPEGLENGGLGRHFSNQGARFNSCGAPTGTSVGGFYHSWAGSEPNDCGAPHPNFYSPTDPSRPGEHVAHFYTNGTWNDFPDNAGVQGYVVEYGGMETIAPVTTTSTATVYINNIVVDVYAVTGGGTICSGGAGTPVNLSGSQANVNYQLRLNGNNIGSPVAGNGGSISFGNQTAAGNYSVVATSAIGNCSKTMSGSVNIIVNTAPTFTVCPTDISVNATTGACNAAVTYTATVTGTPTPSINYVFSGATTASGSGTGSGNAFNVGITNVTITATNSCGSSTCTFSVTVTDNQAPVVTCPANITVNAAAGTCAANVTFAATGTDNCTAPGALSFTYSQNSGTSFLVGATSVTVTAKDAAGNTSASCSFTVTVKDVEAPVVTCPSNITVNAAPGTCAANVTFAASGTDNCTASGALIFAYSQNSGTSFPVGTTTVTVTAKDVAGNTSAPCSFTVIVKDVEVPVITCASNVTANAANGQCNANVTVPAPSATDNCTLFGANTPTMKLYINGTLVSTATGVTAYNGTGGISIGQHTPTGGCNGDIKVDDVRVWNVARSASQISSNMNNALTGNETGLIAYYNCNQGTADGNNAGITSLNDNAPAGGTNNGTLQNVALTGSVSNFTTGAPFTGSGNALALGNGNDLVSIGSPISSNGSYTKECWVYARANGCDNIISSNLEPFWLNGQLKGGQGGNYSVVAAPSNFPLNQWIHVAVTFDNGTNSGTIINDRNNAADASGAYPVGTTNVTWTATDASGNQATCVQTVTVVDNQAPVITCPTNITVNAAAGTCAANVTFAANATDNCTAPGALTFTYSQNSGTSFPVGTTTVTVTAKDAAGNTSAPCNFTVKVVDNQVPIVTCPANIAVNAIPSACGAPVTFAATGTDNCTAPGALIFTYSQNSGTLFPVGNTTVTVTAKDAAGNISNPCSFTVTVRDSVLPTVATQNLTVYLSASGTASVTAAQVNNGSSDNCGVDSLICTRGGTYSSGTQRLNHAKGLSSGGTATVVGYTAGGGATNYTGTNMGSSCSEAWTPYGTLCDEGVAVNSPDSSYKSNTHSGATWSNPSPGNSFGILVTDLGSVKNFNAMSVFQMFSDGKTTHIEAYYHPSTSSTPPAASDPGWVQIFGYESVGTGSINGNYVTNPMKKGFNPVNARYVKFHAKNDGTLGFGSWIEIRSVKLFSTSTPCDFSCVDAGSNSVTLVVKDIHGNTNTGTATITVLDTIKPVITCPADITVNAATGRCDANVTFAAHTTDNCSATVTYSQNPGTTFPLGTTVVTATAKDPSNNTVSCNFRVTVIDNQVPVITCPSNITVNAVNGTCAAPVTFAATATDNCTASGALVFTYSQNSGTSFPVGTTTVTVTAKDAVGNISAPCSFTVTVKDVEAPVVTCASNVTVTVPSGACDANVTVPAPSATDNCSSFGASNGALNFDGSDDEVAMSISSIPANFTLEYWINNTGADNTFDRITSTTSHTFETAKDGSNIKLYMQSGWITVTSLPASTWVHMAWVRNGNNLTVYKNGTQVYTGTVHTSAIPSQWRLGEAVSGANEQANMSLDELRIWNVARTQAEITANMNSAVSGSPAGLIARYSFDQGVAGGANTGVATLNNDQGNAAFNGVLSGFALNGSASNWVAGTSALSGGSGGTIVNNFNSTSNASGSYPIGTTTVVWTATDASGNQSTCSQTVTVNAPEINVTGSGNTIVDGDNTPSAADGTDFGGTNPNVPVTKSYTIQNTGTSSLTVSSIGISGSNAANFTVNGIALPATVAVGGSATFNVVFNSNIPLGFKNATVTINSNDCNEAAYDFAVIGEITCAPASFTACPSNMTVGTDNNVCTAVVTYTATANGTPTPVYTYVFTGATTGSGNGTGSGSTFNKGVTTVTITATNPCSAPACTFTVNVQDDQAPNAICQNITVQLNSSGTATITPTMVNNGSNDNCGPVTLALGNSGTICATAFENQSLVLTAPMGTVINGITFASYGTPDGSCGSFTQGWCHASNSMSIVQGYALGQNSVVIPATNGVFGDPCFGTFKRLYVEATYSASASSQNFNCSNIGNNTVTLKVTDGAGNVSTCNATVTVEDNIAPAITCPSNITVNASNGRCDANVNYALPTATDNTNCITVTRIAGPASGSAFPVGTTTITHEAKDAGGNTVTCSFTITVIDNQRPVITCPADITHTADDGRCSYTVNIGTATATDNCEVATIAGVRSDNLALDAPYPVGTTTVVWTATDIHGNVGITCTQTIVVRDDEKPVITCPADITHTADAGRCSYTVNIGTATATDNCAVATIAGVRSDNLALDAPYPVGTTTVVWTATDIHGNVGITCTQTIVVTDDEKPVITCPADITHTADAGRCSYTVNIGTATAKDNCEVATIAGVRSDNLALDAPYPVGTTTVVWTATDIHGNVGITCTQTIVVTDDERPVITCPADITHTADAGRCSYTVNIGTATATDNCEVATIAGVRSDNLALDAPYPVGTTTVVWIATDIHGNVGITCTQTIVVTDDEKPVITCPADINHTADAGKCSYTVNIGTATATDNCAVATIAGVRSDNLALDAPYPVGTTTVVWTATDIHGNVGITCTQTIVVTDNEKPVITCPADISHTADAGKCSYTVNIGAATATDNCAVATITGVRSDAQPLTASYPVGTTTVVWTATDIHGNVGITCTQTIVVTDNEKPVITCPADITHTADAGVCSYTVNIGAATATDNCAVSHISGVRSDAAGLSSPYPVGTTTVTWTATDIHGNSSTCTQIIVVTDNEQPKTICKPYTLNLSNGTGSITPANVDNNSTDNCAIATRTVYPNTFTCANAGQNTVTLTITDIYGNTSSCQTTVTVQYQPTCTIAVTPANTTYTGGVVTNIYLGYGPQSATLTANPVGGTGFTYSWSGANLSKLSCTNCQNPVFTPTAGGTYTYTVTATNSNGCSTQCQVTFCVKDIRDGISNNPSSQKVFLCHVPPGNPNNPQQLSISINAVPSHLGLHGGDRLGKCDQTCTGAKGDMEEQQEAGELKVYPNPTSGMFIVELPGEVKGGEAIIMDMSGKLIERKMFLPDSRLTFDLNYVTKGVYMVQVKNGDNIYRARVVIQ